MERPKLTAIVTGAISLVLGILYLLGVQILDAREMVPAPIGLISTSPIVNHPTVPQFDLETVAYSLAA